MSCDVEFFNLSGTVAAAGFSSAYPRLQFVATIDDLPGDYWLTGMTLSSSLLNFGAPLLGVFVVIGTRQVEISVAVKLQSPLYHMTLNNSLTGPPVVPIPTNKTTPKAFRQPKRIGPRTPISLYACGDTTAGNAITALLALELVPSGKG